MTTFTVPTIPVAQPRQRHAMIAGHIHNYTPTDHPVNAFKAAVQWCYKKECGKPPSTKPIGLSLTFLMPRPKNMTWKNKPMLAERHVKKPDTDNLVKAVKDCLSGLAWKDDSQVCELFACKWICRGDDSPRVKIEIVEL